MAPREDLISSAVTFLQDPSVASSPLDKRIAFLQSKNLTQEEIDISLTRAGDDSPPSASSENTANASYSPPSSQQQQATYRRNAPSNYNYNPYSSEWHAEAPLPELPKRDWRDWFIMATVIGGASYGLYVLTQRYIKPLIAPPTLSQLEQDKAAIDEQFNRAFALLDTLASDTTALKEAEETRTQRLDVTLAQVESVIADLKAAHQKRQDENRRLEQDLTGLKDAIPKAIDSVRDSSEKRLKELGKELGSLKLLMGNRFGTTPSTTPNPGTGISARPLQPESGPGRSGTASPAPGEDTGASTGAVNGPVHSSPAMGPGSTAYLPSSASISGGLASRPSGMSSSFGAGAAAGRATIPAWQMAAAKKASANPATMSAGGDSSSNAEGRGETDQTAAGAS